MFDGVFILVLPCGDVQNDRQCRRKARASRRARPRFVGKAASRHQERREPSANGGGRNACRDIRSSRSSPAASLTSRQRQAGAIPTAGAERRGLASTAYSREYVQRKSIRQLHKSIRQIAKKRGRRLHVTLP